MLHHLHLVTRTRPEIKSKSPGDREGVLDMELDDCLDLVDRTGRQIRIDKRGAIPDHLEVVEKWPFLSFVEL